MEELRERLICYQRECYDILAQAFQGTAVRPETSSTLMQVRELGRAIMQMAEEQMEFERRLPAGDVVTEDQASQISQGVALSTTTAVALSTTTAVALALGKQTRKNEFGAVYGEMYRKFGITSYKLLPAKRFAEAMGFLTEWYEGLTGETAF